MTETDQDTIRRMAYFKWLDAGAPPGDGCEFWVQAESDYLRNDADEIDQTERKQRAALGSAESQVSGGSVRAPDKELLIGTRA